MDDLFGTHRLVKAGGRQRNDATQVLAALRSANRLEFLAETLRAALEALAVAAPDWLATQIDPEWIPRYGARIDSSRLPAGEEKRTALAVQVGLDGFAVREAVHADHAPVWLREIPAVVILRTVWITQYHRTITDGRGGGGVAGGQRSPAEQRTDLFSVRPRRSLCNQARLRVGRLSGARHRDLR